jgi:hypothetical protein
VLTLNVVTLTKKATILLEERIPPLASHNTSSTTPHHRLHSSGLTVDFNLQQDDKPIDLEHLSACRYCKYYDQQHYYTQLCDYKPTRGKYRPIPSKGPVRPKQSNNQTAVSCMSRWRRQHTAKTRLNVIL